jgi:HAUS augmin-like complex subunit 1
MMQCLCRTLAQLEDEVAPCEAQMESWSTNLQVMAAKERQYMHQSANYKVQIFCFLFEGGGGVNEFCSLS